MRIFQIFQFTWLKLTLLAAVNVSVSFLLINLYKLHLNVAALYTLLFLGLVFTTIYLLMVYTIAPKNMGLRILTLIVALTPFMALPLIAYLWYLRRGMGNPYVSRYKVMLLLAGSMVALALTLTPTEFLSKKELLFIRLLPTEISYLVLSQLEASRVSALSPYDYVSTPKAAAKIKDLREKDYPDFAVTNGMNPNAIFNVLPLGLCWVRGAPAHAAALIHFHYLMRL